MLLLILQTPPDGTFRDTWTSEISELKPTKKTDVNLSYSGSKRHWDQRLESQMSEVS